jgi:tRNA_anti-like
MRRYLLFLLMSLPLLLVAQDAIRISAHALGAAYGADYDAARRKYSGHVVIVSGIVKDIDHEKSGQVYASIFLEGGPDTPDIHCRIEDAKAASRLRGLAKGDRVTVSGTVIGKLLNVILQECTVQ